jgi:peptide/nickel transport system permease protein
MSVLILRKTVSLFALLILVSLIVFGVLYVLPGDPAQVILGINATDETLANLRAQLGIDQPYWAQYWHWMGGHLKGQSAVSITYGLPVSRLIGQALLVTGPLALLAMLVAVTTAIPLGIYAARHQNRPADTLVMGATQLGLAMPEFWLGLLLMLLFAVQWGWLPAGGFPGWQTSAWDSLRALLLPALALGVIRAAILTRLTRSAMLEVLREDYVRTARAKGLRPRTVIYLHALKNALIPVVTVMGLQLGQLLAGAVIIENVYHIPGLGRLIFQAIGQRDLPVVRDGVLFMAAAVVCVNYLVDMAYVLIDPRIRLED